MSPMIDSQIATVGASSSDVSALVHPVSAVLRLWDALELELGDTAVVTDGHRWSRLAALAATWYGALPVLFITRAPGTAIPGVTNLAWTEFEGDPNKLAAMLRDQPGVAAAELTGELGMVDVILESLPSASRLMLSGHAGDLLTIDYYLNVHLKGLRLVSGTLEAEVAGRSGAPSAALTERVRRLLARQDLTIACRDVLNIEGSKECL